MAYTPVEIIALVFMIAVAVKIVAVLVNPKKWFAISEGLCKKPRLMMFVCLVLAAVVLNYLLAELTIIQILAVMAFVGLLAGITMAAYFSDAVLFCRKLLKDKTIIKKAWLSIIIWAGLVIWGAVILFGLI